MTAYLITDRIQIDTHITFVRINPTNIELTLKEVFDSLANLSWLNNFDKDWLKEGYQVRADATVKYIADNIIKAGDDKVTSNSGEYVISELARLTLINELSYSNIPLAELIKKQKSGNPGFDFYSENPGNVLLFGEAKYQSNQNAYGRAFEQMVRFINESADIGDLPDIDAFCSDNSKSNVLNGIKGFVASFASKETPTQTLVKNIQENEDYKTLAKFTELVCVAVNI
jgi:hypothetical protein